MINTPAGSGAGVGDLSSATGDTPNFFTITYNPVLPVSPYLLWTTTAGGNNFTFTLQSMTVNYVDASSINIKGLGFLDGVGFDTTPATWNFSAQFSDASSSWSSSNAAVPEPATMILLGAGIVGVVGSRIRRKK